MNLSKYFSNADSSMRKEHAETFKLKLHTMCLHLNAMWSVAMVTGMTKTLKEGMKQ